MSTPQAAVSAFAPSILKRQLAMPTMPTPKPPTDFRVVENPKFVERVPLSAVQEKQIERKTERTPLSPKQVLFNSPFIVIVLDNCCKNSFTATGEKYSFQMCASCARRNRQARFLNAGL